MMEIEATDYKYVHAQHSKHNFLNLEFIWPLNLLFNTERFPFLSENVRPLLARGCSWNFKHNKPLNLFTLSYNNLHTVLNTTTLYKK